MLVSECVYTMEIIALCKRDNYLIKVVRNKHPDRHWAVGPRDSLSGTILKIQKEVEEWRAPRKAG